MFVLTGSSTLSHLIENVVIYTSTREIVEGNLRLFRDRFDFTGGGYTLNVPYIIISSLGVSDGSEITDGLRLPSMIFCINDEHSSGHHIYSLYHRSIDMGIFYSMIACHIYNVLNGLIEIMEAEGYGKRFFYSDDSESNSLRESSDSGYESELSISSLDRNDT
ncbi:hypothetical protein RF11_07384 [Thelohanellus kitauei]|uniref:Uncharacterized protein n=1 Tax=Thelohanellus kitauei TaxID=669202 RepID=A0A0C2NGT5_THEKT|nr:hypothetical protein RF11_07384 [Thelohanellus kitauei]